MKSFFLIFITFLFIFSFLSGVYFLDEYLISKNKDQKINDFCVSLGFESFVIHKDFIYCYYQGRIYPIHLTEKFSVKKIQKDQLIDISKNYGRD